MKECASLETEVVFSCVVGEAEADGQEDAEHVGIGMTLMVDVSEFLGGLVEVF